MPAARRRLRCPRCQAPVRLVRDRYGAYLACLLCGFQRDLTSPAAFDGGAGTTAPRPPRKPGDRR